MVVGIPHLLNLWNRHIYIYTYSIHVYITIYKIVYNIHIHIYIIIYKIIYIHIYSCYYLIIVPWYSSHVTITPVVPPRPPIKLESLMPEVRVLKEFHNWRPWRSAKVGIYIYIWVNLITTSLRPHWESWFIREIIPKWPYFRFVKYYNLPIYIYTYIYIHIYPLVICYIAMEAMAHRSRWFSQLDTSIYFMDFPVRYVKLPEGS